LQKIGLLTSVKNLNENLNLYLSKKYYAAIRSEGFKNLPSRFTIELTSHCNLNCSFCFQNKEFRNNKDLTIEKIDTLLGRIEKHCKSIVLTGGEIFLRPDIFEIFDLISNKYKKKFFIITNGTLIKGERIKKLINFSDSIIGIQFSIDGSESIHNKLRGSNSAFGLTIDAIASLKDIFTTSISCVITDENFSYLCDVLKIAKKLGVFSVNYSFKMYSNYSDIDISKKFLSLNKDEITTYVCSDSLNYIKVLQMVNEVRNSAKRLGIAVSFVPKIGGGSFQLFCEGNLRSKRKLTCTEFNECRLNSSGDVVHCHLINKSFGNIFNSTLEDIWQSQEYVNFRKIMIDVNLLPVCNYCCKLIVV